MGTVAVEKSTLQALILDIFLKDKAFFKDILREIVKRDPSYLELFMDVSTLVEVENPLSSLKEHKKERQNLGEEDISEEEVKHWFEVHHKEYAGVFKALHESPMPKKH